METKSGRQAQFASSALGLPGAGEPQDSRLALMRGGALASGLCSHVLPVPQASGTTSSLRAGRLSDPSAPTPRGCVSLSSSSAPCVEWLAGVKARPGGARQDGPLASLLPPPGSSACHVPTWSFCRQSPGQVCSRHSETLSSAQMAQISGTGSQQGTSCVLFPPQVGESLQPAPPPPPPHYRARGAAPAAARSWRLGGGGSSLRPATVNPRS